MRSPRRRKLALAGAAALAALSAGCVERILLVRSDPPAAEVFVDGEELGETPLEHRFGAYGTFEVVLRRSGFYSKRVACAVEPPWYEVFPLDFVSEILVPWPIRDLHEVDAVLEPLAAELDPKTIGEIREKTAGEP
jgi:hypothetical protein